MGSLVLMIVCILVLDIHDLCALPADSAHVLKVGSSGLHYQLCKSRHDYFAKECPGRLL